MDFPGVALITGAASGIGRAAALQYAKEGCLRIAIADMNTASLDSTQKAIEAYPNVKVKAIAVDVRQQSSVEDMVREVVDAFGRIDYCVNSAGIIRFGDSVVLPEADFEAVYQVNLRGVFFCVKAEINAMLKQDFLASE
ncbi:hypothetical protein MBLNU459_g7070t1 [Dothideomycetes sp. NU459]